MIVAESERVPPQRRSGNPFTIGMEFGRLEIAGHYYDCICQCGNQISVRGDSLKDGRQVSCGCYNNENCAELGRKSGARTRNMRNMRRNRNLEIGGECLCVAEWSEVSGIPAQTIIGRLNLGWSARRAVFEPSQRIRRCT